MRCYVQSLAIYPRSGQGAIEHSEQAGFDVADGAVVHSTTAQAAGSTHNRTPRPKVGAGGTAVAGEGKPVAQPLAWWSTRHGSRLQAASRRADLPLAGAVAQRRRCRRCGGDRRHEARARLHARWRGSVRDAVARQAACGALTTVPCARSKPHDGRSGMCSWADQARTVSQLSATITQLKQQLVWRTDTLAILCLRKSALTIRC
jgi:hypothetical protein